jgi:protein-disulfide isomerase
MPDTQPSLLTTRNIAIGVALAGAVLFGALIAAFGNAQPNSQKGDRLAGTVFSDSQENEIRSIIREYLLDNPEVIIEAVQVLEARRQEMAQTMALEGARSELAALLDEKSGYTAGKDKAKARVAVIELFDYHCGYCKRAVGLVQEFARNDPDVKVVFRELPILSERSELAARAALAAREQGKYADMHFAMMGASGTLDRARIEDIAKRNGVDFVALEKAMESAAVSEALAETRRLAETLGIDGTPAFIVASVDGNFIEVIPGYSKSDIENAVKEAKKAARRR